MSASPSPPTLRRITAFSVEPSGGNPAGVWIGERLPDPDEMQRIAAEVGYSETAFLEPLGEGRYRVRYFSPKAEVSFCGHATIASGVALGDREGPGQFLLETVVGEVPVNVRSEGGRLWASLTSVKPRNEAAPPVLTAEVLRALGWHESDLDAAIPPRVAWAGASHLVLAVHDRTTLDGLSYDFERLEAVMRHHDLTTLQLVWRESPLVFHARNPFPVGGVVEDPATGAAAAALGGYLRDAGLLAAPVDFTIYQGVVMGRPSRLDVSVPLDGGITVSGTGTDLEES